MRWVPAPGKRKVLSELIIIASILQTAPRLDDLWPPANGREHNKPRIAK